MTSRRALTVDFVSGNARAIVGKNAKVVRGARPPFEELGTSLATEAIGVGIPAPVLEVILATHRTIRVRSASPVAR